MVRNIWRWAFAAIVMAAGLASLMGRVFDIPVFSGSSQADTLAAMALTFWVPALRLAQPDTVPGTSWIALRSTILTGPGMVASLGAVAATPVLLVLVVAAPGILTFGVVGLLLGFWALSWFLSR